MALKKITELSLILAISAIVLLSTACPAKTTPSSPITTATNSSSTATSLITSATSIQTSTIPKTTTTGLGEIWRPGSSTPIHWQWQIGTPFNVSTDLIPNVTVYDIDAFDTSASVVASLHTKGYIVIAYASFGTYENWRPDAASFPASVKGSGNGWPGEKWLDIRSDAVKTIMAARLDLIKSKGLDAVEPDNVDGYSNSTGFLLTAQD